MTPLLLVIDDDPDILRVLRANLEFHGFRVLTAGSWVEGGEALTSHRPDLVVLDVMLPDGDGIEICRFIRESRPSLPIILLTARDKISDKVMGLESGADDYMIKPFETLELVARIRACLRRTRPLPAKAEVVRDLHVDCRRRVVRKRGKTVLLTPKEYDLLCFLLTHRDAVVSREDIRKHLWKKEQIYAWSRVIDVHVQHLRQKIEDNPAEPEYIVTVPGVGYMLRDQTEQEVQE